jgi:hypothetical protein
MAFTLETIVPWGRSYDEYVAMFNLTAAELSGKILGCGDGPASFNCEATQRGFRVVSADPLYEFSASEIERQIRETSRKILEQLTENQGDYVWHRFKSPESLLEYRMAVMRRFLEDYPAGRKEHRYRAASLPALPFGNAEFDLALCSHLLFTFSERLSTEFHYQSIVEMCRVAKETRIFPLRALGRGEPNRVNAVVLALRQASFDVEFVKTSYEFQKGADTFLRVKK